MKRTLRVLTNVGGKKVRRGLGTTPIVPVIPPDPSALAYEWSDSNLPWAYEETTAWESRIPSGTPRVNLQTGSGDFWTNLNATINAAPGRVIVNLPAGVFSLKSFRLIGGSGDQAYSFGFWFPKLAGFSGQGADKTFVQMDANSMTQAQLTRLSGMTQASFAPNQMSVCRIDSTEATPFFLGGLTFRSANQQNLTSVSSDFTTGVVVPQPAPHQGPTLYSDSIGAGTVSHVRFQGAGKGMMSQPPFEMANVTSQKNKIYWYNVEFDGRISPDFDPARPRKCGTWMGNNERESHMTDCWLHHSNLSRYAANDENLNTAALSTHYSATRCKAEQITNTKNDGLGGYTNATPFGWESSNAQITMTDCIISQDNPFTDKQIAQMLQLTSVGSRNPQGGRLRVSGGVFRNTGFPALDGFLTMRVIASTYWATDGYANTMNITNTAGTRLTAYVYSGSWPPTAAALAAAGVKPSTHFIVRNT